MNQARADASADTPVNPGKQNPSLGDRTMESSLDSKHTAPSAGQIISRGFLVAHCVLAGAILLTLLHAPAQLASALMISLRDKTPSAPGTAPEQLLPALLLSGVVILLAIGVFFLFPLIQGGVLGQVRDRLDSPDRPPRRFGFHSRVHYSRLLGNQLVFTLIMMAAIFPLVCVGAVVAVQSTAGAAEPPPGEVERQLLSHPVFLGGMVLVSVLSSAVGMIYWVANCVVVAEGRSMGASWRSSFQFCRRNFPAVLAVWLVNLVAGAVLAPLGMLGQFGVVSSTWGLSAVALIYSLLIGYWGVIVAGMSMSLYLGRRTHSESEELAVPAAVGA
jgi:hypothetical protein